MKSKTTPVYNLRNFIDHSEENDFYCNNLSTHLKKYSSLKLPHKQNFFLSILFTQGKGIHQIDFSTHIVKRGCISMVAPGQVHQLKFSKDIEGIIFLHTSEFYDLNFTFKKARNFPFFCSIYNTSFIHLHANEIDHFIGLYQTIHTEHKQNTLMSRSKICSLIDIIYTDTTRLFIPGKVSPLISDPYLMKFIKFEELVNANFKNIKSPNAYAELLHISERHLNRICKTTVNKTVGDVIHERVILEAKRMLAKSRNTINEVAQELGYDDTTYFSRLFKKEASMTASEFIKHIKKRHLE
jgi:AraC-like DNA-binding protein